MVMADIFYVQTLFPTCFGSDPRLFEKHHEIFRSKFSPKRTSQWRHKFAQHTPKNALVSSEAEDVFADSLAHSFRELWPITTLRHDRALCCEP